MKKTMEKLPYSQHELNTVSSCKESIQWCWFWNARYNFHLLRGEVLSELKTLLLGSIWGKREKQKQKKKRSVDKTCSILACGGCAWTLLKWVVSEIAHLICYLLGGKQVWLSGCHQNNKKRCRRFSARTTRGRGSRSRQEAAVKFGWPYRVTVSALEMRGCIYPSVRSWDSQAPGEVFSLELGGRRGWGPEGVIS